MTITETAPNLQAETDAQHRHNHQMAVLLKTSDDTRRIHWWIRLFGVVWLTTMALGLLVGAGLGILAVATANDVGNNLGNGGYTNRAQCRAAVETTIAQCNAWFGTP